MLRIKSFVAEGILGSRRTTPLAPEDIHAPARTEHVEANGNDRLRRHRVANAFRREPNGRLAPSRRSRSATMPSRLSSRSSTVGTYS